MSLKAGLFAAGSTRIGKALKNVLPTDLNKVRNSTDAAGVGNTCTNGEWECTACTMANTPTASSCGTCATPRSGSLQEQVDTAMPPPPSTPGEWKCAACTMANAPTVACCGTCATKRSGAPQQQAGTAVQATFEVIVPALAAGTTLQAASPDGQLISFQVPAAATTGGIINVAYTPMHTVVSIANISPTRRSNSMNFGETKQYEAAEHPPAGSEVRTLQRELVDLVDMVECGRLQAMLDQQRAGNVGGTGAVAQFVFTGMGLGLVLLFFFFAGMTLLGQLTMGQFFAAGVWLPALGGPLCFVRVYFLCKLNLQETGSLHSKLFGSLMGEGSATAALKNMQRTIWLSVMSYAMMMVVFAACMAWPFIYYSGGTLNLWPFLPSKPTHTFAMYIGVGVPLFSPMFLILGWMIYTGKMKWAHTVIILMGLTGGLVFFPAAAIAGDDSIWFNKLFLVGSGLYGTFGSAMVFLYQRYRQCTALTSAMRGDVAAYAVAWAAVTANPTQKQDLREIEEMLARQPPSQRMVSGNNHVRKKLRKHPTAQQVKILLTQAWAVNGKFQGTVASWKRASSSGGGLAAAAARGKVLLPKRRQRAIEKVWRSYGGNATRLRDLVRASLTFETVGELKACLALILADGNACVLGVKNRFASTYDAIKLSCGYRDIQLSVTFSEACFSPEEVAMELHEHVCEVQLHLAPIYTLKNDEGHKRYVKFRNCRAE